MANPFLVLGGIAVGIVTAAFGVLAVPGWVASAQDASALNDLSSIRAAQSASVSQSGSYFTDLATLTTGTNGVKGQLATSTDILGLTADGNSAWCAAAQSGSGGFLAASNRGISTAETDPAGAMSSARCSPASIEGILDNAYGAPTEVRRNLAAHSDGTSFKDYRASGFGIEASRYPSLGRYSTVDGWARYDVEGDLRSHGFHLAHNPENSEASISQMAPVTAGATYTLSLDMKSGTSTYARICHRFGNSSGWTTMNDCGLAVDLNPAGVRVSSKAFTVPAGSTHVAAYAVAQIPIGGYIAARNLLAERSATVGTYFDGNTAPANAFERFAFVGTPGQSASVMLTRPRAR